MDQNDNISSGTTAPTPPPPPPPAGGPTDPPPYAGQPGQPGLQGPRPQDRFFDGIRRTGLRRSQHRVIAGVSGGIAERTGIDVTVVRVLTVVLAIFGGVGILAYGLAWLFLPEPDGRIHAEQVLRGDVSAGAVGGIITTVLSFGGFWSHGPGWGWGGGGFFGWFWGLSGTALFIGVVALVIYAISQNRGRPGSWTGTPGPPPGPPSAAPYAGGPQTTSYPTAPIPPYGSGLASGATMTAPPPTAGAPLPTPIPTPIPTPAPATPRRKTFGGFGALAVAGFAAIGAGVTALVMSNGTYDASTGTMAWAVALAVISASLVIGGAAGRRAGVIGLLAVVVALGTLVSAVIPKMSHVEGAGDRTWRPVSVSSARDGYGLGAGDALLDLSALERSTLSESGPVHVPVSVAFGRLRVRVPSDLGVEIKASAGAGDLVRVRSIGLVNDTLDPGVFLGDGTDRGDVNGIGVHRRTFLGSGPVQVVVDAKVGFGQVQIEEVP